MKTHNNLYPSSKQADNSQFLPFFSCASSPRRKLSMVVAAGTLLAGAVCALTGHPPNAPVAGVIRAQRFELVDANGKVEMVIGALTNGTTGIFMPDTDKPLILLGVADADGAPTLMLNGRQGFGSVLTSSGLTVDNGRGVSTKIIVNETNALVGLKSDRDDAASYLYIKDRTPGLTLSSPYGQVIVIPSKHAIGLTASAKGSKEEAALFIIPGTGVGVNLLDKAGKRRGISTTGDVKD